MDTQADAAISGILLGACVGAALAERTRGRSRAALRRDRRAAILGPRYDRVGALGPLFSEKAAVPGEPWIATSIREGLSARCDPMADFVDGLDLEGRTRLEATAYAMVAAAVSAAVDGCRRPVVTGLAVMAGEMASGKGTDVPGPDVTARLQWASALAVRTQDDPLDVLDLLVGTSEAPQECVPAAFALVATCPETGLAHSGADAEAADRSRGGAATPGEDDPDAFDLCVRAAGLGGASDVIAVVVGALLGAERGADGFPPEVVEDVHDSWPALRPLIAELATSR